MKNKMSDLRNHLFETLESLKDEEKPMELARAHAIRDVAQTIINSAKVEVDLLKAMDGTVQPSPFLEGELRDELEARGPRMLDEPRRRRTA